MVRGVYHVTDERGRGKRIIVYEVEVDLWEREGRAERSGGRLEERWTQRVIGRRKMERRSYILRKWKNGRKRPKVENMRDVDYGWMEGKMTEGEEGRGRGSVCM